MTFLKVLMVSFVFATIANADLADQYKAQELRDYQGAHQREQQRWEALIYKAARMKAKSEIIGGPEITPKDERNFERWYFQMANGMICNVPVSRNGGDLTYVFGFEASCKLITNR